MMITALFCLTLTLTLTLTLALVAQTKGNGEVKLSEYVLQDPSVHGDLLFTDSVSFDANTNSKLDCARMCARYVPLKLTLTDHFTPSLQFLEQQIEFSTSWVWRV